MSETRPDVPVDGNPSYSVTWERPEALTVSTVETP